MSTRDEKRANAAAIREMKPLASTRYEAEALESLARSWDLHDLVCADLALKDAQVWATLHLAEVTSRGVPS